MTGYANPMRIKRKKNEKIIYVTMVIRKLPILDAFGHF
jgi:hypothetical protein